MAMGLERRSSVDSVSLWLHGHVQSSSVRQDLLACSSEVSQRRVSLVRRSRPFCPALATWHVLFRPTGILFLCPFGHFSHLWNVSDFESVMAAPASRGRRGCRSCRPVCGADAW